MPYRNTPLITNEYYHVYNRGVEKRAIFLDERDKQRFLDTLSYYCYLPSCSFSTFKNMPSASQDNFINHTKKVNASVIKTISWALMPNHFHLLVKQISDNGVSNALRCTLDSFTKYFNTRHKRVGPLFQGPFKAILIQSDELLMHISRYIHLNPFAAGIITDPDRLFTYAWTSLPDYFSNRISTLTLKDDLSSCFSSISKHKQFILDQTDYQKQLEIIKHQTIDS